MLYVLITGKRRICNNLSITAYTIFRKIFIKQYHVIQCVEEFSVFRHQFIAFHYHGRAVSMNGFNKSSTPGTRFKYRIILIYAACQHYQPVCHLSRSLKKLVFLLKIASFAFFQYGEHTFRIERECEALHLATLPGTAGFLNPFLGLGIRLSVELHRRKFEYVIFKSAMLQYLFYIPFLTFISLFFLFVRWSIRS